MEPFIGEIMMFGGNFAPKGWAYCDGQILPIAQNTALFSLLGTTYGGNGKTTFGLPNLIGRMPIHRGERNPLGASGGEETVTLTAQQIPSHTHALTAVAEEAVTPSPAMALPATAEEETYVSNALPLATMSDKAVAVTGGNQPHSNMQPYLCVAFVISLFGIYPQRP